jgi:hypothetical protein
MNRSAGPVESYKNFVKLLSITKGYDLDTLEYYIIKDKPPTTPNLTPNKRARLGSLAD